MGVEFTFQLSCNLEDIVWTICLWFQSTSDLYTDVINGIIQANIMIYVNY